MQTIWYRVIDHCEDFYYDAEVSKHLDISDSNDQELIAAKCADYHNNHDGWESNWPLTFTLHTTEDGPELAKLEVNRKAEPHFYASHIKTPNVSVSGAARPGATTEKRTWTYNDYGT